ncbi:MAG: tRNA (guanosine(46)-N7)-methyltransferase TrmB [Opitutus sp.]
MITPTDRDEYRSLINDRRTQLKTELLAIFPSPSEFVWEIGSGHGHFLTEFATHHPLQTFLGIDIIADRVARATRKRDRAQLKNLHFLHTEARLFLEALPEHATISSVLILFPDPWPKKRHNKHRILQSEFLTLLRPHVRSDAPLFFRTDHQPYFEHARATLADHPLWKLADDPWPFEHETVFQHRADSYHSLSARPRP